MIIFMEYMEYHAESANHIRTLFYLKTFAHLEPEQQASYDALRKTLFNEINPSNAVELEVFEQLIHSAWQLERTRALEDFALNQLSADPDNQQFRKSYSEFSRARRALDRTINSAIKELRRLITTRVLAVAIDCNTVITTQTDAKVPALLDLIQTLRHDELRPRRAVLSMSLAKLKNPHATYTPPEIALASVRTAAA